MYTIKKTYEVHKKRDNRTLLKKTGPLISQFSHT